MFAAEYVDERCVSVRERVNADVALGDDYESADPPFLWIVVGTIDESIGCCDLVHRYDVRELVKEAVDEREVGEFPRITIR